MFILFVWRTTVNGCSLQANHRYLIYKLCVFILLVSAQWNLFCLVYQEDNGK